MRIPVRARRRWNAGVVLLGCEMSGGRVETFAVVVTSALVPSDRVAPNRSMRCAGSAVFEYAASCSSITTDPDAAELSPICALAFRCTRRHDGYAPRPGTGS